MSNSVSAVQRSDFESAFKSATLAARQGQYEDADRNVTSLTHLAAIAQELDDLATAEKSLRRALDIIDRVPGQLQRDKAILHNNLGAVLDLSGDVLGAEQQYRSSLALTLASSNANQQERFSTMLNLAGTLANKRDMPGALTAFSQARALLQGLPLDAAIELENNIGVFYQATSNPSEARARFIVAKAASDIGSVKPVLRASVLHNLGTSELEVGNFSQAETLLVEALTIRKRVLTEGHVDTARTFASMALLREKTANFADAIANARLSSSSILTLLATGAGEKFAARASKIRSEWRESFSTHLRLLIRSSESENDKAVEALGLLQALKQGELAKVFSGASAIRTGGLATRLHALELRTRAHERIEQNLNKELQSAASNISIERTLRNQLADSRNALNVMQLQFAKDFPKYIELVSGRIAPMTEIQSSLSSEEAALIYLVGNEQTFAIAITRESARLISIPVNRNLLAQTVKEIRKSVAPESADERVFAAQQAHALYKSLIFPFTNIIGQKSEWYIVADGPLESLPLSLLLQREMQGSFSKSWNHAPWLIRDHALTTLPSLSALTFARNAPPVQPAPEQFLAFADPVLAPVPKIANNNELRSSRPLELNNLWGSSKLLRTGISPQTVATRFTEPSFLRRLPSLPETADEARAVATQLGSGTLLLQRDATETRVKQMDLSRYRNLLFATHGAMASELAEVGQPALILTPPDVPSELDDGVLTVSEIAELKLNADWVLLSACNTAASDGSAGSEGLSGLAKAFFHAGARNLLVSHWSVVSDSTVLLSTGTFKAINANPLVTKAQALRQSMIALMDQGDEFQHPMFWAPFVLVGSGR